MSDSESSSDQEDRHSEESSSEDVSGNESGSESSSESEEDEPSRIMRMIQEFDALPPYAQKIVSEHIMDRLGKSTKKEKAPKAKKKKKKEKKITDPAKPKHPTNAYLYFTVAERKRLQQEQPNASRLDRVRMMSEKWAKMTDEDKRPYLEKAQIDKERYKREIAEYEHKFGRAPGRSKRKSSSTADDGQPRPPKRPPNAYLRFSVHQRAEWKSQPKFAGMKDGSNMAKRVGDLWRTLSDEEKRPYYEIADQELEEWKRTMEQFKANHPGWVNSQRTKRRRKKKVVSDSDSDSDDSDDDVTQAAAPMYPGMQQHPTHMYHPNHYAQIVQHQQYMQQHHAAQAAAAVQQHYQQQQQQQQQQQPFAPPQ